MRTLYVVMACTVSVYVGLLFYLILGSGDFKVRLAIVVGWFLNGVYRAALATFRDANGIPLIFCQCGSVIAPVDCFCSRCGKSRESQEGGPSDPDEEE